MEKEERCWESLVVERVKQSAARIFSFNYAQLSMLLLAKVQPIRNVSLLVCRMARWSNRVVSYRAAATSCSSSTNIDLQHLRLPRSTTQELFSSRADSFYFFGGEPSFDQCGWICCHFSRLASATKFYVSTYSLEPKDSWNRDFPFRSRSYDDNLIH